MGSRRDDFRAQVKSELARRVNYHCSICDAQTVGPKTGTDKSFSIGKAAHIKAAAPGGPRYDPDQTAEERRSIQNGIWACSSCSEVIDRDERAYTVADLWLLKEEAEQLARRRIGRPPAMPLLASPLTPTAVADVVRALCHADAARLEQLDPRFSVSAKFGENGRMVYTMRAREPIDAKMVIEFKSQAKSLAAFRDVLDYGGMQAFEGVDLRLEGSPLFSRTDVGCKRWTIESQSHAVALTVEVEAPTGTSLFLDFAGQASHGEKGVRFKGTALSGLIETTLILDHDSFKVDLKIHFELQSWTRKPLLGLPNFNRVKQVACSLSGRACLKMRLAWNGVEMAVGSVMSDGGDYFKLMNSFIAEVECLRKLDKFFGLALMMPVDLDEILREQGDIDELLRLIDISEAEKQEITATLVPAAERDEMIDLIENQRPAAIRITRPWQLRSLGKLYGPFMVEVSCPQTIVVPVGPANIVPGVKFKVMLRAAEGHRWTSRCLPTEVGTP